MPLKVRDIQTDQVFVIDPSEDRVFVKTRDGVKVRLHPYVINHMVKSGSRFDGHTQMGPRKMRKEKG